jgi:hypothetical protein
MCCRFTSAAGSGTSCGANHFVDREGYCVVCGVGTAGVDPKDRTQCLCKSGWGIFQPQPQWLCSEPQPLT